MQLNIIYLIQGTCIESSVKGFFKIKILFVRTEFWYSFDYMNMTDIFLGKLLVLSQMLVLGKEIVQNSQGRFQIIVGNVFWSCFGLRKAGILHQFKGQADICDLFVKGLKITLWLLTFKSLRAKQRRKCANSHLGS